MAMAVSDTAQTVLGFYTIASDGTMSPLKMDTMAGEISSATVNLGGTYVLCGTTFSDAIYSFELQANGSLSGLAVVAHINNNCLLRRHPSKDVLYIIDLSLNTISQFKMNSDGTLTALAVPTAPTGTNPQDIVFAPTGNYAYVVNKDANTVRSYQVSPNGTLTVLPGGDKAVQAGSVNCVISPDGKWLYVFGASNLVTQFLIGANGALSALAPATFDFGMPNPRADSSSRGFLAVYRELDEGLRWLKPGANGALEATGQSTWPSSNLTNVFGSPWNNAIVFASATGTAGQVVTGTASGTFTLKQSLTLPTKTKELVFFTRQ